MRLGHFPPCTQFIVCGRLDFTGVAPQFPRPPQDACCSLWTAAGLGFGDCPGLFGSGILSGGTLIEVVGLHSLTWLPGVASRELLTSLPIWAVAEKLVAWPLGFFDSSNRTVSNFPNLLVGVSHAFPHLFAQNSVSSASAHTRSRDGWLEDHPCCKRSTRFGLVTVLGCPHPFPLCHPFHPYPHRGTFVVVTAVLFAVSCWP